MHRVGDIGDSHWGEWGVRKKLPSGLHNYPETDHIEVGGKILVGVEYVLIHFSNLLPEWPTVYTQLVVYKNWRQEKCVVLPTWFFIFTIVYVK
jgi:hypothetical protein